MAEKRAITIWVNGKEIKNDISSINSEYLNLLKSQRKMIRGSEDYVAAGKKIRELKGDIDAHNKQLRDTGSSWDKLKGSAAPALLGLAAGFMTVSGTISALINTNSQFEKSLSSLGALTGASKQELDYYGAAARQIGSSSTVGASEAVKAMELIGSAKPDLLKSKDALIAVTKEAVALAEAAGMDLPAAADSLTKVMNQFSLDSSQAGRTINVLAAGAKEGAVAIPGIADAVVQFGAVAKTSNVSLEDSVTLIELLGEKGISGAEAGTKLRNVLITLAAGPKETNPQIVGLTKSLENLKAKGLDTTAMTTMFGKENMVAAQILVNSAGRVDGFTKAISGTREAYIQQAKQTDNLSSSYSRFKNKVEGLILSFNDGNGLTGAMKDVVDFGGKVVGTFTKWISIPIEDKLRKEQMEVNALAMELTDVNTPTERRKKLLEELEKINPAIVKGLDAEKINYAQLSKNIEEYNTQLTNRIILSNLQEDEESNLASLADQRLRTAQLQVTLSSKLVAANKDIALGEGDMESKKNKIVKLLQDQVALQESSNEAGRIYATQFSGAVDSRSKEKKLLEDILFISQNLNEQQDKLSDKQKTAVDYQARINSLKEILGLNTKIETAPAGGGGKPAGGLSDEYLKKEKELVKKLAELRFSLEQINRDAWLREIYETEQKYALLEVEAKGHTERLKEIAELKGKELKEVNEKYAKSEAEKVAKTTEDLYEKLQSDMEKGSNDFDEILKANAKKADDYLKLFAETNETVANATTDAIKKAADDQKAQVEKVKKQLEEIQQYANGMVNIFSAYDEYRSSAEDKELNKDRERNTEKKRLLDKQLNSKVISQSSYNRRVAELDADLDLKTKALQLEQAKRKKKLLMFQTIINTAAAIMGFLNDPGGVPGVALSIIAGAVGALQIATISQAAPGFEDGGEVTKETLIRAGEGNKREVILSNKTLNNPTTGPIGEWLFQKQKGLNPVFPGGNVIAPRTSAGGGSAGSAAGQVQPIQNNVTAVVPGMDAVLSEMQRMNAFLSDPKNRQAYFSTDLLKKHADEEATRTSLKKIT